MSMWVYFKSNHLCQYLILYYSYLINLIGMKLLYGPACSETTYSLLQSILYQSMWNYYEKKDGVVPTDERE